MFSNLGIARHPDSRRSRRRALERNLFRGLSSRDDQAGDTAPYQGASHIFPRTLPSVFAVFELSNYQGQLTTVTIFIVIDIRLGNSVDMCPSEQRALDSRQPCAGERGED